MARNGGGLLPCARRSDCFHLEKGFLSSGRSNRKPSVPVVLLPRRFFTLSMAYEEKSRPSTVESSKHKNVPVFVMMPIDTFGISNIGFPKIKRLKALTISLRALKLAGVHGIAVEVWWGMVESSPLTYNWFLYQELFKLVSESGLKLHVALSFHSSEYLSSKRADFISLPPWVVEVGYRNRNIYYQDQHGFVNDNYLTLGVDHIPLFYGRTALQCYEDFITSFVGMFGSLMGIIIEEVSIGLGPSGELRYPSHPRNHDQWRFPGIGEFQCYDKYMMEDLKMAAHQEGKAEWGDKGPQNAGGYNSISSGLPFFEEGEESFLSGYGQFFLEWYSGRLIQHADAILARAKGTFHKFQDNRTHPVLLVAKIGMIYWWYQSISHAAELTSGYYNTAMRDGYDPLVSVLSQHRVALHISCLEMRDKETLPVYMCSPEGLIKQLREVSKKWRVYVTGRNTKERIDKVQYNL